MRVREELAKRTPTNPALAGHKAYSQNDEDGIIAEIFRRIGVGGRVFLRLGAAPESKTTHMLCCWRVGVRLDRRF